MKNFIYSISNLSFLRIKKNQNLINFLSKNLLLIQWISFFDKRFFLSDLHISNIWYEFSSLRHMHLINFVYIEKSGSNLSYFIIWIWCDNFIVNSTRMWSMRSGHGHGHGPWNRNIISLTFTIWIISTTNITKFLSTSTCHMIATFIFRDPQMTGRTLLILHRCNKLNKLFVICIKLIRNSIFSASLFMVK